MTTTTFRDAFTDGRTAKVAKRRARGPRTPILSKLARALGRVTPGLADVRTFTLQVGGLGFADYAAFEWHHTVGYLAIGASLLLLDFLHGDR
jgi:hypothetical protein